MKIPSNNQWTQTNNGNVLGLLHETHNLTFDKGGEAKLSKKALALVTSDDDEDFGEVMAIVYFDGNYHIVTDDKVFSGDLSSPAFTEVGSSPTLGPEADGIVVFDRLYVSDETALAYVNTSGAWTTGIGSLTDNYPHPLAVFDSLPVYKLAVGDNYQVKTYDSSGNANSTVLSLPQNYVVTCLEYQNGYLFIGTKEVNGGEAALFLWNGDGTNAQYKIGVGASWIYSMTPYRGTIALTTNEGELLMVNGTSVSHLAGFPVFYASGARWETGNALRGKIYRRGMVSIGDQIFINASGDVDIGDVPEMKSGVWCYDPQVGLYHYASASTDHVVIDGDITASSSIITTAATHNLILGDAVEFTTISGLSGVSSNRPYYAIPVSSNTLKVAATRADAFLGNNVTITGTATTDALQYAPNTDFGNTIDADSGAIAVLSYLDAPNAIMQTDIIFGTEMRNNAGVEKDILCVLSPRFNYGTFSTQKILAANVSDVWQSLYTYVAGILGSNEKAIIKALYKDALSFPSATISGAWATTTQLSSTDPAIRNILELGDEIILLSGYGQGKTAHITVIETTPTTTIVTIDESFGLVGSAVTARFTKFRKVHEITSSREEDDFGRASLDKKTGALQFKVELRGFEPGVRAFELTNQPNKG